MDKTLKELKEKFSELAGRWNGKTEQGEFESLDAREILEVIEELESKIKKFEEEYEF